MSSTKAEIQFRIINAAVDSVCDHMARMERAGGQLIITKAEAAARVVHYALREWTADVCDSDPISEWERSADDVVELVAQPEWHAVALASRSADGRAPVDWTAVDRCAREVATCLDPQLGKERT